MTNLGTQPVSNTPDEFAAFIKAEDGEVDQRDQDRNIKAE